MGDSITWGFSHGAVRRLGLMQTWVGVRIGSRLVWICFGKGVEEGRLTSSLRGIVDGTYHCWSRQVA